MTYVEFFNKTASENICSCLSGTPERVIFVGGDAKLMKKHITYYQRVFSDRGESIGFLLKGVSKNNLTNAIEALTEIVNSYDDCVFDVTGGEEVYLVALGIVAERYKARNIQIHKFNVRNGVIYDFDNDGFTIHTKPPELTVEENIRIFGGDVVYSGIDGAKTYKWNLTDEFEWDIDYMWSVCAENVRLWNRQIAFF